MIYENITKRYGAAPCISFGCRALRLRSFSSGRITRQRPCQTGRCNGFHVLRRPCFPTDAGEGRAGTFRRPRGIAGLRALREDGTEELLPVAELLLP